MERSEWSEIVEVIEEEIYNSDVVDQLDEAVLSEEELKNELGPDFMVT